MAQLIAKLVGWFAEHIIVAGLSRSKRFQGLALWIDHHVTNKKQIVEDHTKIVTSKADEFAKTFKKVLEEETKAAVEASKVQAQSPKTDATSAAASVIASVIEAATPPPSPPPTQSAASSSSKSSSTSAGSNSSGERYTNSPNNRVDRIR